MTLRILDQATDDLVRGFEFYEEKEPGLGEYFLSSLYSDMAALHLHAGVHRKVQGRYHRALSRRFPFAIYYTLSGDVVSIHAILDCRRRPSWIRTRLAGGERS